MNPVQLEVNSQDHMAPIESKAFYQKPMLTTFGSVAKLTQGGSGTKVDGTHVTHK